jgi:hypothetical protein
MTAGGLCIGTQGAKTMDEKERMGSWPEAVRWESRDGWPEVAGWKSQVVRRMAVAAFVAIILSGALFSSYFLITQIQRAYQSATDPLQSETSDVTLRNKPVWALGDTPVLSAPGTGKVTVHVGQQFPLTLLGGETLVKGALWYQVKWTSPAAAGSGWLAAKAVTFTSPGNVPGWASFDILSSDLATYLNGAGEQVGAVVYDMTRQRYYTYNMDGRFITGSSIKVPIMLAFLNKTEHEGRVPTSDESCLLTHMIENSDNDAASAFFFGFPYDLCGGNFESIGRAAGLSTYLKQIGITGLNPDDAAWGYSTISPLTMVKLLTLLNSGKILTQQDRNLAFNLMENIEADQQVGVGDTAPNGATVAMKDGWLQADGPDGPETGLWAMNSSGIVTLGKENYIISVYTDNNSALEDGQAITEHVCRAVASALT